MMNNNIYYMDKLGEKSKDYQKKNYSRNNPKNVFLGKTE